MSAKTIPVLKPSISLSRDISGPLASNPPPVQVCLVPEINARATSIRADARNRSSGRSIDGVSVPCTIIDVEVRFKSRARVAEEPVEEHSHDCDRHRQAQQGP